MLQQETERDTFINQITVGSKENILHLYLDAKTFHRSVCFFACRRLLSEPPDDKTAVDLLII